MKIEIESTPHLTDVDGVPCRKWIGRTEQGNRVDIYVHRIRSAKPAWRELDAMVAAGELEEVLPPRSEQLAEALRQILACAPEASLAYGIAERALRED